MPVCLAMKRMTVLLFLAGMAVLFTACEKEPAVQEASGTGLYFDTVVDIKICDPQAEELLQGCFDLCEEAELTLSAQNEESELYRLNHRDTDEGIEVSEELAACIARGLEFGRISDGKFDITILPLRELWDFEAEDPKVPAPEEIEKALARVDYRKVRVEGTTVNFEDPETQLDLGGIAKGYISKQLKEWLAEQGCTSALINLGGNVSVLGTRPDGKDWVVGIQEPFTDRGTVLETVDIADGCVISSGTYERYFEENGNLYHHILDPETGWPVQTTLQQVTVIGKDDILCDAFSTISVLVGKEEAERLVRENGWDVRMLFVGEEHAGEWYP